VGRATVSPAAAVMPNVQEDGNAQAGAQELSRRGLPKGVVQQR
jgi:hypothetical protein